MAKRISKDHFMNTMRKKQRNGMSKNAAYKSTVGYVKSGKAKKPRTTNRRSTPVSEAWLKIENYYFILTLLLVFFSLIGANQWFSNTAIKIFSGLIMGIPGSAIVESILNFFGLKCLKNYNFTWKFWKIKWGISYYAIAVAILELLLF